MLAIYCQTANALRAVPGEAQCVPVAGFEPHPGGSELVFACADTDLAVSRDTDAETSVLGVVRPGEVVSKRQAHAVEPRPQ